MDVVIAGAHGKIALRLARLLHDRGDRVRGLIRNPEHADDLRLAGASPVLFDLEQQDDEALASAISGADAFVFAAGAGPGSGDERKETVDKGGAIKGVRACERAEVGRFVIVSSMGADDPESAPEGMRIYQQAKHDADEAVMASSLRWTVVRPGHLTDDDGAGTVRLSEGSLPAADVSRQDVAAVLAAVLADDSSVEKVLELREGTTPVEEAVASPS